MTLEEAKTAATIKREKYADLAERWNDTIDGKASYSYWQTKAGKFGFLVEIKFADQDQKFCLTEYEVMNSNNM